MRKAPLEGGSSSGVTDGTRTRDIPDHNRVLYQLSYDHHGTRPVRQAPAHDSRFG